MFAALCNAVREHVYFPKVLFSLKMNKLHIFGCLSFAVFVTIFWFRVMTTYGKTNIISTSDYCVLRLCTGFRFVLSLMFSFPFLPRDAMRKRSRCCSPVSVRPSVCHVHAFHPDD